MSAARKGRKKSAKAPSRKAARPAKKDAKKPAKAARTKPAKAPAAKKAPQKKVEAKPAEKRSARKTATPAAGRPEADEQKTASRRRLRRPPKPEPTFSDDLRPSPLAPPRTGLGTKYTCFKCGKKFYDLNRPDPKCPKCGADQRDAPRQPSRPRVNLPAEPEVDAEAERAKRRPRLLDEDEEEVLIDDDDTLELGLDVVDEAEDFEEEEEPAEESD